MFSFLSLELLVILRAWVLIIWALQEFYWVQVAGCQLLSSFFGKRPMKSRHRLRLLHQASHQLIP